MNQFLKKGAPFLGFMLLAPYAFSYLQQARYDFKSESFEKYGDNLQEKLAAAGIEYTPSKSLEEEYADYKKNLKPEEWKNIRGPRAWEDNAEWEALKKRRFEQLKEKSSK